MNFLCELTIRIPQLPYLFKMAQAVSTTVELVNSVTANCVILFTFAMCTFPRKYFPMELVLCSHRWQTTGWQTIYIIPRLPVSSIPPCELNRHQGTCLEQFQVIEYFERTFIEADQAWKIIWTVSSLQSWIKTRSVFEDIIIPSNKEFQAFESDIAVGTWNLGNSDWVAVKSYLIVMYNAGS